MTSIFFFRPVNSLRSNYLKENREIEKTNPSINSKVEDWTSCAALPWEFNINMGSAWINLTMPNKSPLWKFPASSDPEALNLGYTLSFKVILGMILSGVCVVYPWVTRVKVSKNMAFNSEDLLYRMEIWGHQGSLFCVIMLWSEVTRTWWYSEGDWVLRQTLRVSLLCGTNRKLAKKKSEKKI